MQINFDFFFHVRLITCDVKRLAVIVSANTFSRDNDCQKKSLPIFG